MFYVYILHSKKDGRLYTGFTPDLRSRLKKHKEGLVKATRYRLPLELIYYEAYFSETDARRRELYLKGGKGKNEMKIQLQQTYKHIKYKHQ